MLENCFCQIIAVWFVDLCLAKWWDMSKAEIIYSDAEPSGRSQSFCIRRSTLLTTSTCVKNLPRPLPADFLRSFLRQPFLMDPPPPPLPPLASLMWGEAELQDLGWKSALTDWGKVTAVGGQPVNITGPHASQRLIYYLNKWTNAARLFVPKGVKINVGHKINVGKLPSTQ